MKSDPRIITARFNSTCAETGKPIKKGEECVYYPKSRKVYSMDSEQYKSFREWKFDQDWLGANY